jgi:hypothetical protein
LFFYYPIFLLLIGIEDSAMLAVDWGSSCVNELDISSTELTEDCLVDVFSRMPKLTYLAVPNCDGFTDKVDDQSSLFSFYLVS